MLYNHSICRIIRHIITHILIYNIHHIQVNSLSEQARMMVGIAICNLLCCKEVQSVAIAHGGLSVLKVLSITEIQDMKESISLVIMNLVREPTLRAAFLKESLVSVLNVFLQEDSSRWVYICIH